MPYCRNMNTATPSPTVTEHVDLALEGLHCAACVNRSEQALVSVPGVSAATVNLATERAAIDFDPTRTSVPELVRAVAEAGYAATPLTPSA